MQETLRGVDAARLEPSCAAPGDRIRFGTGAPGLERAEVHLTSFAFEPHRHDTYAIAVTTTGVQTFRYRGELRVSLPGQLVILDPDETHDGGAGTDAGFGYRSLYVAPELVREALAGQPLPFVAEPVQRSTAAAAAVASLLGGLDEPISDLRRVEIVATVADLLRSLASSTGGGSGAIDVRAVELARGYLRAHAAETTPASVLERVAGIDRFTLARHFRRAFGTSPDRYRTLRRLALARSAIERGVPLAQAAAGAGFADQSHMTRQFKRAYGFTPGRWGALTRAA